MSIVRSKVNSSTFDEVLFTQQLGMSFYPQTQPWYATLDDFRRRYAETVMYNDGYKIDFMAQKPAMENRNGSLVKHEQSEKPQEACKDKDLM